MNKSLPRKYRVVAILFCFWLLLYFQRINISVLIVDSQFLHDLGILNDTAGQGLLMTLFLLSYSLANILTAPLGDRFGPTKVILVGSIIAAIASFYGGFAVTISTIFWARIVIGLGQGLYFPAQSKLISNWFLPGERSRANSIWAVAGCVGPVMAIPFFAGVIILSSWHYVFYITGIISLIMILPIINKNLIDSPAKTSLRSRSKEKKVKWSDIKDLLKSTQIWLIIIAYMAMLSLWWGLVTWLPQYLVVARNFNWTSMGYASTLPYVCAGLFMLMGGFTGDIIKNQAWIGVFSLLGASICIFLAVITKSGLVCAFFIALGLGFNEFYFAPIWSVLQTMLPEHLISTGSGLMNGLGNFFSGLAPVFIGLLIQLTHTYNSGLIYLAVIGLIGSIASLCLAIKLQG